MNTHRVENGAIGYEWTSVPISNGWMFPMTDTYAGGKVDYRPAYDGPVFWRMDKKGKTHEKIYDVAVSDGRVIGADGRCKTPVGNTVDLEAANWTNTIGASELAMVWTDPGFSAAYFLGGISSFSGNELASAYQSERDPQKIF